MRNLAAATFLFCCATAITPTMTATMIGGGRQVSAGFVEGEGKATRGQQDLLRFCDALEPWFDKTCRPGEAERVKQSRKRSFAAVMIFSPLLETGARKSLPLVTIPAG